MWGAVAAVAALVIGFAIGMCTYRASRRWCPVCGATLTCSACSGGACGGAAADPRAGSRP